jgi:hypothetical protein
MSEDWLKRLKLAMADALEADAAEADRRIAEILTEVLPQLAIDRDVIAVAITALATDRNAANALAKLAESWWRLGKAVAQRRQYVAELEGQVPAQERELLLRSLRQIKREHAAFAYAICLAVAQLAGAQEGEGPTGWFAKWQEWQERR